MNVAALKIGRAKDCQLECERAIRQIKEITNRLLPRKAEFLTEILQYKGLALLKLKEFEEAARTFQEEFDVANDKYETASKFAKVIKRIYLPYIINALNFHFQ